MIRIIILLAAFFATSTAFSQKENIVSVTFNKKIIEKTSDNNSTNIRRKKLQNKLEELEYTLQFNNNFSIFQIVETLASDYNKVNSNFAKTIGGTETFVINNLNNNVKYYTTILLNESYTVYEDSDNIEWNIENETKRILGYSCQKAKTTVFIDDFRGKQEFEVYAWFTKEIPSNYGPSTFSGLPGTILEIQYGDIVTYAVKVKTSKSTIKIPDIESQKVSAEEFISIFNKKMNAIRQN